MKINLEDIPKNNTILKTFLATDNKLNNDIYKNISVSISGGSDSDIVLDIITKTVKTEVLKKIKFVFFDTKLEYQATLKHLNYLEKKYNIHIERITPEMSITETVRKFGQPCFSKNISKKINLMQSKDIEFKECSTKELCEKHGRVKDVAKWWNSEWSENKDSQFNISKRRRLKNFLIKNPPSFLISDKCCTYTKKEPVKKYYIDNNIDIGITGIRQNEGGIRSMGYNHSCFTDKCESNNYTASFRPLWNWTNEDKKIYKDFYKIKYSDCYEIYGMTRTGCAGCPFNLNLQKDLQILQKYEPNIHKAVCNIFKDSYNYIEQYNSFRDLK